MKAYTRVYAQIHLDRLTDNVKAIRRRIPEQTMMMAVVKADAYGHGAVETAKAIEELTDAYGVATVDEALSLRKYGTTKPILILGPVEPEDYEAVIEAELRCPVFRLSRARLLEEKAAAMGKKAFVHLAVDVGMSRIGFRPQNEGALEEALEIGRLPHLETEGIFTHFPGADEADKSRTREQLELFLGFVRDLEKNGLSIPVRHCANSAGIVDLPETGLNMVRAGIILYGLYPSEEVDREQVPLRPVMELKTRISFLKTVPAGTAVSYGSTVVTERATRIATLPAGYADGYSRNLSGRGSVLICGKRAPILGRICMDQMMVDVTDIEEAREGSPVVLLGRDGDDEITAVELADLSGGFHYELVCAVSRRVPRLYLRDGQVVGVRDGRVDGVSGI